MSAVSVERSDLPGVEEPGIHEEPTEVVEALLVPGIEQKLLLGSESLSSDRKYKLEEEDNHAPIRTVVIGEDDEEDGPASSSTNIYEEIDPYKDYDLALYDHDYIGMLQPGDIPKVVEEGNDLMPFPVIDGLASRYVDEEIDEQHPSGPRNMIFSSDPNAPIYRFREFHSRQGEASGDRGHAVHTTTPYRLSSSPVVYGGKTLVRYSSLAGSQPFRTPIRDTYPASPSSPRTISGYGTSRRISFSGSSLGNGVQRKTIRPRISERSYEQPGLRVMASPTKQYSADSSTVYQPNAASFVADPMRAANDNAPAPFIVPARGSRPSLRGKGQARSHHPKQKTQEMDEKHLHLQQNVEDDSHLNLSVSNVAPNGRQTVVLGMDTEHLRAESPVTSIVESAHREAVRRASESGQPGDSMSPIKLLNQSTPELQHSAYALNENDQVYEGGQQARFQTYIPYEQQQMDFYGDNGPEQYAQGADQQYFVEEDQRNAISERYIPQQPQRHRLSSRSSTYSGYRETSPRVVETHAARGRSRGRLPPSFSSQAPSSRSARQVPIPTRHMSAVFANADEKPVSHDTHISVQPDITQAVPSKQKHVQLVTSSSSLPSLMQHPQEVTSRSVDQYAAQQPVQHAQLSSPEQQLNLSEQSYMPPILAEPAVSGPIVNAEGNYDYVMSGSDGSEAFGPRIEGASFVNEETSSGEETSLANVAQDEGYGPRHVQNLAMRSSMSTAEEETSFTEDPSEERGTEEEEQRTQKIDLLSEDKLDEYDGWSEGDEYTTRCYCAMNHNDDFMIQCDVCNVWQHMVCVGVDRNRVPKVYKCENCNPRLLKLSVAEAKAIQTKYLELKRRRKLAKPKIKKSEQKTRKRTSSKQKEQKLFPDATTKKFVETNTYDYSRTVAAFAKRQPDTGNIALLDPIRNNETVRVMYVAQDSEGLVSTRSFRKDEPVVFVCGRVCMPSECPGREKPGSITPFVMLYAVHSEEPGSAPVTICIDARRAGSTARFARRSCKPNVRLQHMFSSGKLYIFGVATEDVERGDEITLPFDPDYALAKKKLICACTPDEESSGLNSCEIRRLASALEESSAYTQKPESGKKIPANDRSAAKKALSKSKKQKKEVLLANVNLPRESTIPTTEPRRFRKIITSSRGQTKSTSGTGVTDEENVISRDNGSLSSGAKDSIVKEAEGFGGALKMKLSKKAPSAALKAASQKKKGAIKLKRRARKASLKTKSSLVKRGRKNSARKKEDSLMKNEISGEPVHIVAVTSKSSEKKASRKQIHSVSAAAVAMPIGTCEVLVDNGHPESAEKNSDSNKQDNLAQTLVDFAGNIEVPGEPEKTTLSKGVSPTLSAASPQGNVTFVDAISERNLGEASPNKVEEAEETKEVKKENMAELVVDQANVSKRPMRMKRKSRVDSEKEDVLSDEKVQVENDAVTKDVVPDKKVKVEDDTAKSSSVAERLRNKDLDETPAKKIIHHRRELPEFEVMNYMLPGDRNKTETREERKMKQQLALFERMQKEMKRKEERRMHQSPKLNDSVEKKTPGRKKAIDKKEPPRKEAHKKTARVDKSLTAKDISEPKEALKTNAVSPIRRSARVSGRDQDKGKMEDSSGNSGMTSTQTEVGGASLSTSPSQHSAFLTAPRKRWAAAARTDSVENPASTSPNMRSSAVSGQKAYLLRRTEPQSLSENNGEVEQEIQATGIDREVKSEETEVSPTKKRRQPEPSLPMAEAKVKVEVPKISLEVEEQPGQIEPEKFSSPPSGISKITAASRELATYFAEICAITSGLAAQDFFLPPNTFPMKGIGLATQREGSFPSTSTSVARGGVLSPSKKPQKKKMSLDEYKKRRETRRSISEERSEGSASFSKSFIPMVKQDALGVSRRSSLRLGSLPDPTHLRDAQPASLDDLKRRIYGKPSSSNSSPKTTSSVNPRGRTPPEIPEKDVRPQVSSRLRGSPPPPPPPSVVRLKSETKEVRLPLEERLQMLLGGADAGSLTNASLRPPPPPPPSLPPTSAHTRANSRKAEIALSLGALGRTPPPPPPIYSSSGFSGRTRRH